MELFEAQSATSCRKGVKYKLTGNAGWEEGEADIPLWTDVCRKTHLQQAAV